MAGTGAALKARVEQRATPAGKARPRCAGRGQLVDTSVPEQRVCRVPLRHPPSRPAPAARSSGRHEAGGARSSPTSRRRPLPCSGARPRPRRRASPRVGTKFRWPPAPPPPQLCGRSGAAAGSASDSRPGHGPDTRAMPTHAASLLIPSRRGGRGRPGSEPDTHFPPLCGLRHAERDPGDRSQLLPGGRHGFTATASPPIQRAPGNTAGYKSRLPK